MRNNDILGEKEAMRYDKHQLFKYGYLNLAQVQEWGGDR